VGEPQISPDARWIAYTVTTPDVDANRNASNIWIVSASGGDDRQLTRSGKDQRPRWSPDGKTLAFLSSRDGAAQIYSIPLEGGEPTRITSLSTGVDNELWSPDGKWIAFISDVYPDCKDDVCNSQRDAEHSKNKVKARVYDKLLYRHWTSWSDGKRSHLFISSAAGGAPRDLTPGVDYDVPPFNLGEPEAISFSPDSRELCFTANTDKDEALSTNGDLFTVATNGSAAPRRITSNPADDWGGLYSPDGKWIAYRAQMQPGYESDRWRLMLYDRRQPGSKPVNLTEDFDSNVESVTWSSDSSTIYFETEEKAELPIYSITAVPGSKPKAILANTFNGDLDVSRDGHMLAFTRSTLSTPAEIFVAGSDG
ncbi:MAG: TolB family protein, partial [Terracidiphilus sp.]